MSEIDRSTRDRADEDALFGDVAALIESARTRAAAAVNSELVMLYWHVGSRVREGILGCERAAYGQQVVKRLAARLTERYGRGYSQRGIEQMMAVAAVWPDAQIAQTLSAQSSWSHLLVVVRLRQSAQRSFYLALSAREHWTVRTLRAQISGKLYERTIAARGSDQGIEAEIARDPSRPRS
jgi:hypothetical protein